MKQQSKNLQGIKGDEAVASGVWPLSAVNDAGTPTQSGAALTQPRSGPVRFEIIDYAGNIFGDFESAQAAADFAHKRWPTQEQDPDRTGNGWDVQVVGS